MAGINLFSNLAPEALRNRLRFGAGTRPARSRDSRTLAFRAGAFVPAGPWQARDRTGISGFCEQNGAWDKSRSVCLLRLPPRRRRELGQLGLATASHDQLKREDFLARVAAACIEIMSDFVTCSADTACHGIGVNRPGMLTTSIDYNIDRLVGLHVDHWDGLPLTQRARAGNRLAINVGTSPYYIFMLAPTLEDMARMTGVPVDAAADLNRLPGDFLAAHPALPVCRIRILPFDVYIAPTDNIIHDGSTRGGRVESRQIVYRGHIQPTPRLLRDCAQA